LDHLFQLIVVLELSELAISLPTSSDIVRTYWSNSDVNVAPARAWLMHRDGDADSMLLFAAPGEQEKLSSNRENGAPGRASPVAMETPASEWEMLSAITLSSVINGGKLALFRTTLPRMVRGALLIDCSDLVPRVVNILAMRGFVSEEEFTSWATERCHSLA